MATTVLAIIAAATVGVPYPRHGRQGMLLR